MTIRELLALSQLLTDSDSAALDAELLLCHCLQKERAYLYTWPELDIDSATEKLFRELIERRVRGEPVAYLLGYRDFWSFSLAVNNSTLIPRPDTERLVEVALELLKQKDAAVLDLGTGTGAIALALAKENPAWQLTAVDVNAAAVELAQHNARALALENAKIFESDWFEKIPLQPFDLIVSNPPYIDGDDPHLTQGDVRFEPRRALVAEKNGLAAIAQIIADAQPYLKSNAWLLFEHGFEQAPAVRTLLSQHAFDTISTWSDLGGHERVTGGRWRGVRANELKQPKKLHNAKS
ncbi:MAG: prmC [Verrucomicrobiaceae bacterium]|nr:prmC [Verrucomicrobiaceae bacterium]